MTRLGSLYVRALCVVLLFWVNASAADISEHPQFEEETELSGNFPHQKIKLAQAENGSTTNSNQRIVNRNLIRRVRSATFLFGSDERPQLVVNWSMGGTRPNRFPNGNTDIQVWVNDELVEVLNFTGIASFSGGCAGGNCNGCPIGLLCSGPGYCLCDTPHIAISAPMDVERGDRVRIRLIPARGGGPDLQHTDKELELVY